MSRTAEQDVYVEALEDALHDLQVRYVRLEAVLRTVERERDALKADSPADP